MSGLRPAGEVENKVIKLLREVMPWRLAKKEIGEEMLLQRDLGIDSMGLVALAFRVEEELGVDFNDFSSDVGQIRKVGDVLALAKELTGGERASR